MWAWILVVGCLVGLVLLSGAIARRWGRGSNETTARDPLNEIQGTNQWRVW